jgi:hypothetical protein
MAEADPFGFVGLTYDDVLLLPGLTDVIPSEADTTSRVTRRITPAHLEYGGHRTGPSTGECLPDVPPRSSGAHRT